MNTRYYLRQTLLALGLMVCGLAWSAGAALPDATAFGVAVERGDRQTVQEWLAAGLSPDFMADRIGSGLMIAAWEGDIAMMELFIARGARLDLRNRYDEQALQLAAWRGHAEAVQWLLDHGAPLNRPGARWGALHYAAFADRQDIVKLLLERGADVNARAPNGSTALMMAAREGHEALARQLLDAGADTKAVNDVGESALIWAMRHEHFKLAQLVSSPEEFARASRLAASGFGVARRSQPAPAEIEEILRQMRLAQAAGKPTEKLRQSLFAAVARFKQGSRRLTVGAARPAKSAHAGKPRALVITARRGRVGGERAELVYAPRRAAAGSTPQNRGAPAAAGGDMAAILEKIQRAEAAGQPTAELRKALFDAVTRFKQDGAQEKKSRP